MNPSTVVLFSGGMDSTTLLYDLRAQGWDVNPIGFDYGQRHNKELDHADRIARSLGVDYPIIDLAHSREIIFRGSSQTDREIDVPEGHYAEPTMKLTVVPNRNMIMLALANAYAQSIGAQRVAYAAHAGDHAIYPDCRPEFVDALNEAFLFSGWDPPHLHAPYTDMTKADIVIVGSALGVPYGQTWSCYKGTDTHCGKCGTCTERREAFLLAGVSDPTEYGDD